MKKKILIALSIIFVLITVFIYNYYNLKTRNEVERLINEKRMINILLAGSNDQNRNRHGFFSLISINPVTNKIGITYIPPSYRIKMDSDGDNWAKIEEVDFIYFDKIKRTLSEDLKLSVPFYIKIYAKDVIRSVNLLEGIDLFLLDQIEDKTKLKFGENYFDGKRVMRYINSVEEKSIYLKYDRTLDILMSLYHNKEKYSDLNNITFITELFRDISTNLMPQELSRIASLIYEDGGILSTLLPGGFEKGFYVTDHISFKQYENDFLHRVILTNKSEPPVKVKILNGTNVPGLARKMRNRLMRDGLNVVEFGTSPFMKMQSSLIINRKGDYSAAKSVSEITGIKKVYYIVDNTELHNVLVIIGKDMIE